MSTLREARERLADLAPGLNPEMYRRLNAEIEEAARHATAHAEHFLSGRFDALDAERQRLLVEACQVRDAYEALEAEGGLHRLTARDYASRLADLNQHRDRIEARRAEIARQVEDLSAIEDDPETWTDEQWRKYPATSPTFTF
jgi:hypothetical protein